MRVASLGSGSRGNATLIQTADACVLVDCGFPVRETERRLAGRGVDPAALTALLVTHEHSDHLSGVLPLARRYRVPVYMTAGTARAARPRAGDPVELLGAGDRMSLCGLAIEAVEVPHDAREPVQYIFAAGGIRFGVLTDLGSVTPHVIDRYRHCDALLLEANHDRDLLATGVYPPALKRRVGGDWGHLSNCQAAQLLQRLAGGALRQLVIGHVSRQNNSPDHVRAALGPVTGSIERTLYADQDNGFGWLSLS
ncbi:MAG: MBL fold metallo-hydrolase [Pseudomonadota bacterium]